MSGGIKIGKTKIKHGLFLAPMAGFTDRAMRIVCHSMGADAAVTEMVSAKAVCFNDKKTEELAQIKKDEGPVLLQIFGSDKDTMARAAYSLQAGVGIDGAVAPIAIDINFGCPVNKIFGNGDGSALMKDPEKMYGIVKAVAESIDIPCTVKLRAGIDPEHVNAVECALACESAGAALVAIHGRTRVQMYSGSSDRSIIRSVKSALRVPVVANGDITDAKSALDMLEQTGADGIMIGRGAVGNPFVFSEIKAALDGNEYTQPTAEQRAEIAIRQLELAISAKGEKVAVTEARKQIALYFKGFFGSAALRAKINTAVTLSEVCGYINECVAAGELN